jgi:hypothetical protein
LEEVIENKRKQQIETLFAQNQDNKKKETRAILPADSKSRDSNEQLSKKKTYYTAQKAYK